MAYDSYQEIKSDTWIDITDKEFDSIRKLVYEKLGVNLTDQKKTLVTGRLQKILRQSKFKSFDDYYKYLISDKKGEALSILANQITTNHTFFYREHDHFDFFQKTGFPEIVERKRKLKSRDLRIWSAGCSSGEEPYMLVMLMMETLGADYGKYDAGILATDISEKALNMAKRGVYSAERMKNLPKIYLNKYFRKTPDKEYEVKEILKREVTYRRFNLMNRVFPFKEKFDIIFCRNVMIYFDAPTREKLVLRFADNLIPGGFLFIGHSETLNNLNESKKRLKYVSPAIYKNL